MRIDVTCYDCNTKLIATGSEVKNSGTIESPTCPNCGTPIAICLTLSADGSMDYTGFEWTLAVASPQRASVPPIASGHDSIFLDEQIATAEKNNRQSQNAEPANQPAAVQSLSENMLGTFYQAVEDLNEYLPELKTGDRLYHYEIRNKLGTGNSGTVFEAEHIYLKDRVAIKVLNNTPNSQNNNQERVKLRFIREALTLAAMRGPFSLRIIDAAEFEGRPYLVSEILDESNLQDFVLSSGPMTRNQSLDLLEQMAEVLCRQEKLGIVHRDIKPSNIHIRKDGTFCLIDFGLASIVKDGPARRLWQSELDEKDVGGGTPAFMSPEQAEKFLKRDTEVFIDHRSDLFSLGLTIWFCLAGQLSRAMAEDDVGDSIWLGEIPTPAKSMMELAISECTPSIAALRKDLDDGFVRIVSSLTHQDPEERYSSAQLLMDDIENYRYGGRRPYGATIGSVFVAIPFAAEFDPLFDAIVESCGEARLAARRVDRMPSSLGIWDQIEKDLVSSKIVIAVFSPDKNRNDPNPNVLTEAAHARAIKKPLLVLTTQVAEDLPFDSVSYTHLTLPTICSV